MKMRSFKAMALWFAMVTMASSASLFADCHHHSHHSHHSRCVVTVQDIEEYEGPIVLAANGVVGNSNNIFVAQAFIQASGGDSNPATNSTLAAFVAAETGSTPGGAAAYGAFIANRLSALGVSNHAIQTWLAANAAAVAASINYSTVVASGADSTAAFAAWQVAGEQLAIALQGLGHFSKKTNQEISQLTSSLVINEAQSIQGYNQFLPSPTGSDSLSQFEQAALYNAEAHRDVTALAAVVFRGVLCQHRS